MKNMKKISILLSSLILTVSCQKEFLDVNSETALTTGNYFQTEDDMIAAVNGIYAALPDIYNNAWMMGEMASDNTYYALNISRGAVENEEAIANHNAARANPNIAEKFRTNYVLIARANQVLQSFELAKETSLFSADFENPLKGQALFLRSLSYFDLVQFFGEIPLVTKPAASFEETRQPAVSPQEVYNLIISDLNEAASILPSKLNQEPGRATKEAAYMLLANIHIVLNEWSLAQQALTNVIGQGGLGLEENYADVFDPSNKNGKESIFEIQYLEGNQGFASNFSYAWLPVPMDVATYGSILGVGNPQEDNNRQMFNTPSPELIAAYEENDKRYEASIQWASIVTSANYQNDPPDHPYVSKFVHPHANWGQANENWPVYRYAEAKLFMSEVLFELNNLDQALQHLNDVRERAGLDPLSSISKDAILKERRLELAFEAKRYLDLKRTDRLVSTMTAMGAAINSNPQAYYYPPGTTPPANTLTTIVTDYEIPSAEASLNPNID